MVLWSKRIIYFVYIDKYIYTCRLRTCLFFLGSMCVDCLYTFQLRSRFLKKRVSETCHDLQCCRSRNFASVPKASTGLGTGRYIICLQSWQYIYTYRGASMYIYMYVYIYILCVYIYINIVVYLYMMDDLVHLQFTRHSDECPHDYTYKKRLGKNNEIILKRLGCDSKKNPSWWLTIYGIMCFCLP